MSEHQNSPAESLFPPIQQNISLSLSLLQSEAGVWKAGHREDRNTETLCHGKKNTHTHTNLVLHRASDATHIQTPDTIFLQLSIRSPSNAAHLSQRTSFQSRCHVPQCPQIWQLCAPGMPFALGRRVNPFSLSVFFLSLFFFFLGS